MRLKCQKRFQAVHCENRTGCEKNFMRDYQNRLSPQRKSSSLNNQW